MNSGKKSFYIRCVLLLLLFGFCYVKTYTIYAELQRNFNCISVRIQDEAVTKKKLMQAEETMREQSEPHIPELAAYYMTEHTQIQEPNLGRTTAVTLYGVYGQMKQITPSELTSGNYVTYEDYAGCIIDEDSAFALFGSTSVTGQVITIDKKKYYIRGVIESETPIVMIQDKSEDAKFWNLELDYGELLQGREYAGQLMMNYGLAGNYVIIEQNFIADCLGNLLVVPVLVLVVVIIVIQWKKIRANARKETQSMEEKHYRMRKDWMMYLFHLITHSIGSLVIIAAAITVFCLTWKCFGIMPMRYVPSKWSDFNQYIRFFNEIKSHLGDLSYVSPTRREVLLKQNCMNCIFYSVAALFLEWHLMDLVLIVKKKMK